MKFASGGNLSALTYGPALGKLINRIDRCIRRCRGLLVKTNGLCAVIDSHQHVATNSGGMIIMADHPKKAILEFSHSLRNKGYNLDQGTLTWVQYTL